MNWLKATLPILLVVALLTGCNGEDSDLPSGTYEGEIKKVNADEKEIYVEVQHNGQAKVAELYFQEETELVGPLGDAAFDLLKEGMTVEITVQRDGDKLIPKKVVMK
jgi:hypothetical protein